LFKESITYRGDYWRAAWRMFTDNPTFGVGLGNYGDYFNRYRDAAQVARRGPAVGSDVAHSMPLDFLAMGGITLGIAYLALIVYSVFLVISKIRSLEGINKQQGYIVFSLLGAYLLQSLISIDQIGLAVWGWIFIGVALSFAKERKLIAPIDPHLTKIFVPIAALVTAISFISVSVPMWRADSALKQLASVPAEQQGVDTRAIRLQIASNIESITPRDSQFKTQIALYLLSNGQAEGIDYAKKALEQNPSDSSALRYLIIAYGQLNDSANLQKYKAEALKIDPFNPDLK
jgi:O-antigen ligase